MTLNALQQEYFTTITLQASLRKATDSKDQFVVYLTAPGGAGKSYTTSKIIEHVLGQNPQTQVLILAPTHSALSVCKEMMLETGVSKMVDYKTVASFLKKIPGISKETGRRYFARQTEIEVHSYDLVFVDESSMLPLGDYEQLLKSLKNSMIVFMGDKAQLPPVMDTACPFLDPEPPIDVLSLELTEVMRNSGKILEVSNLNREGINLSLETLGELACQSRAKLVEEFLDALTEYDDYEEAIGQCMYIASTNQLGVEVGAVAQKLLRLKYFSGADTKSPVLVGEVFRNSQTLVANQIFNGSRVRVLQIVGTTRPVGFDFDIHELRVENLNGTADAKTKVVLPTDVLAYKKKIAVLERKMLVAKLRKDESLCQDLLSQLVFLNKLNVLSLPYACTAHRSQGMTVSRVFVDGESLRDKRQAYVAVSRAKDQLRVTPKATKEKKPVEVGSEEYSNLTKLWRQKTVELFNYSYTLAQTLEPLGGGQRRGRAECKQIMLADLTEPSRIRQRLLDLGKVL